MGSRNLRKLIDLVLHKDYKMNQVVDPSADAAIKVYGVTWCPDCRRSRSIFEEEGVPYVWVDIDEDKKGESFVLAANRGNRSVPTIIFPDGSSLVEPSGAQLRQALQPFKIPKSA